MLNIEGEVTMSIAHFEKLKAAAIQQKELRNKLKNAGIVTSRINDRDQFEAFMFVDSEAVAEIVAQYAFIYNGWEDVPEQDELTVKFVENKNEAFAAAEKIEKEEGEA